MSLAALDPVKTCCGGIRFVINCSNYPSSTASVAKLAAPYFRPQTTTKKVIRRKKKALADSSSSTSSSEIENDSPSNNGPLEGAVDEPFMKDAPNGEPSSSAGKIQSEMEGKKKKKKRREKKDKSGNENTTATENDSASDVEEVEEIVESNLARGLSSVIAKIERREANLFNALQQRKKEGILGKKKKSKSKSRSSRGDEAESSSSSEHGEDAEKKRAAPEGETKPRRRRGDSPDPDRDVFDYDDDFVDDTGIVDWTAEDAGDLSESSGDYVMVMEHGKNRPRVVYGNSDDESVNEGRRASKPRKKRESEGKEKEKEGRDKTDDKDSKKKKPAEPAKKEEIRAAKTGSDASSSSDGEGKPKDQKKEETVEKKKRAPKKKKVETPAAGASAPAVPSNPQKQPISDDDVVFVGESGKNAVVAPSPKKESPSPSTSNLRPPVPAPPSSALPSQEQQGPASSPVAKPPKPINEPTLIASISALRDKYLSLNLQKAPSSIPSVLEKDLAEIAKLCKQFNVSETLAAEHICLFMPFKAPTVKKSMDKNLLIEEELEQKRRLEQLITQFRSAIISEVAVQKQRFEEEQRKKQAELQPPSAMDIEASLSGPPGSQESNSSLASGSVASATEYKFNFRNRTFNQSLDDLFRAKSRMWQINNRLLTVLQKKDRPTLDDSMNPFIDEIAAWWPDNLMSSKIIRPRYTSFSSREAGGGDVASSAPSAASSSSSIPVPKAVAAPIDSSTAPPKQPAKRKSSADDSKSTIDPNKKSKPETVNLISPPSPASAVSVAAASVPSAAMALPGIVHQLSFNAPLFAASAFQVTTSFPQSSLLPQSPSNSLNIRSKQAPGN